MKSFLARLALPRPLLNGQLIDWLILLLIAAVVAVIFRGWPTWPEAQSWGTWGEWAGAIGGFSAAVAAVGLALWSHARVRRKDRLAGLYAAFGAGGPLIHTHAKVLAIQQTVGRISRKILDCENELPSKISSHAEWVQVMAENRSNMGFQHRALAAETAVQYLRNQIRVQRETFVELAKLLPAAREHLDEIPHMTVAEYAPELAREIVQARRHLDLAATFVRNPDARDEMFLELGKTLRVLDYAIMRTKRAAQLIEAM